MGDEKTIDWWLNPHLLWVKNPAYSGKISNFMGWIQKEISLYLINHHQQTKYHLSLIHSSFFPNDLTVPFQLPRSSWSSVGTALAELIRQMATGPMGGYSMVQRPFPWGYHGDFDSSCSYRWWGYWFSCGYKGYTMVIWFLWLRNPAPVENGSLSHDF